LDKNNIIGVGGKLFPYLKEYKWANVFSMLHNLRLQPSICQDDFSGKMAIITGATSGIGRETARLFASRGANLLFINRNEAKSDELCNSLQNEFGGNYDYILADFSKLSDIRAAAKKLVNLGRNIDVLIHNAGLYTTKRTLTTDNLEVVFQTNYLSTFIINYALRDKFISQQGGRILFINSEAYRFAVWGLNFNDLTWEKRHFSGIMGYGAAKLAQLLSMIKFVEYFSGSGVTINAMHPGNIRTSSGQNNNEVYKFLKKIFIDSNARPINLAAEAIYYLGVSKDMDQKTGNFFNLTTEEEPAPPALDLAAADKLWHLSLNLGGLYE
jgi:NAD(P)-dependent dehydrogenase (short-subunit alcohol dehydrogenase family)